MKKTILFTTSLFMICELVNAQYGEVNQRIISGSFNLSSSKSGNDQLNVPNQQKNLSHGVEIGYGKFIKKNVLSVFTLGYYHNSNKNSFNNNQESSNVLNGFSIGYQQVHFKEIAKKLFLGLSIGGDLGVSTNSQKNLQNERKSNSYGAAVYVKPVLSYQITDRFALNLQPNNNFASIGFNHSILKDNNITISEGNTVSFNAGIFTSPLSNMRIGINYLFKNKGK